MSIKNFEKRYFGQEQTKQVNKKAANVEHNAFGCLYHSDGLFLDVAILDKKIKSTLLKGGNASIREDDMDSAEKRKIMNQ